jgi:hypothetical protein
MEKDGRRQEERRQETEKAGEGRDWGGVVANSLPGVSYPRR